MLRAIHIKRFGVFTDTSFALGAVNVFGGANQSGKSTLFDAIRIHAFHPERRGKANQALYARYGDDTDVRLDWDGEAPEDVSDAAFMNLFAVSAGRLQVDLDGDWLAGVKKSLFAGGIDPRNLIAACEQLASDKGTYAHMRARKRLVDQQEESEARLADLEAQRAEILAGLDAQEADRSDLKGITARLGALKGAEAELAAEVAWEERIAERVRWERHLALLDEIARLEAAQQGRAHLAQDRTGELDALEAAQREADTRHVRAEEARTAARARAEALAGEVAGLEREHEARRNWPRAIEALEARMARHRDGHLSRLLVRGALAAFLLALGVAAPVAFGAAPWTWAVTGGAALAVLVLFTALPWLEGRRLLRELKDRWRNLAPGTEFLGHAQPLLAAETLEGVTTALAQVAAELDALEERRHERGQALAAARAALAEAEAELAAADGARQVAAAALRDWLAGMHVQSRDAYRDALGEYRATHSRLAEAYGRLEHVLAERGFAEAQALRSAAGEALAALRADNVPAEGASEDALQAKRERLEAMRAELGELERRRHELDRTRHGEAERLVGRLGTLPDELAAGYERLRQLRAEIAVLDFDRRAAGRALELFQAVADDETSVLAELSEGVARVFARISGVEEAHQAAVALAGLRTEDIRALDRNGVSRPVGHLSSGAQHLLYLALRLEMARRERQGRFALLCLDEPFAFLDPERQLETLQYLREFLEETGWQLILFTNEPAQAERAQAVFPDCRVHRLG